MYVHDMSALIHSALHHAAYITNQDNGKWNVIVETLDTVRALVCFDRLSHDVSVSP